MLGDEVDLPRVQVVDDLVESEGSLAVLVVLEAEEGIEFVVDLVGEEEVTLGEDLGADVVDEHVSEGELVVGDDGAVVPGDVAIGGVEVDLEAVVGLAVFAEVVDAEAEVGVAEGLGEVEAGVDIPLLVPPFNNTVVELEAQIVSGLDLRVEGPTLG
jgi:hypothetical protein